MRTAGGLEFVNREKELAFLARCLTGTPDHPPLIFLRGPAGVGKSSLTDRFRAQYETADLPFCRVDPELMDSPTAPPIYQGLFLQRCAVAVDQEAAKEGSPWPGFADFLKSRRWKTAQEKPRHELIEELPSPESLYRQAVDYASRLLSIGRFEPSFLLESDQSHAVSLCVSYLQYVLDLQPSVLILREAQLSDIFSLRTLLGWQLTGTPVTLILEYTCDGSFLPAHEKAILRAAELRGEFSVLEVPKLSLGQSSAFDPYHPVRFFARERGASQLERQSPFGARTQVPRRHRPPKGSADRRSRPARQFGGRDFGSH